jgi:hypothetical protein
MMCGKKVVIDWFKKLLQNLDGIIEENKNITYTRPLKSDSESRAYIYVARMLTTKLQCLVNILPIYSLQIKEA